MPIDPWVAKQRPRVLAVQPNLEWYGSDRSFVLLVSAMSRRGWEVAPLVPGEGEVARRLRSAGLSPVFEDAGVVRPKVWGPARTAWWLVSGLPLTVLRTARLARDVDLVHCNTSTALGAMLGARLARRPLVVHLREHLDLSRLSRLAARLVAILADAIVAVSTQVARDAAQLGLRCTVIYNGVEFDETATSAQTPMILSVGRLNEWKGHEVLVEAVAELRRRGLHVRAQIAGDPVPGDEARSDALRRQIDAAGLEDHVLLLGYVDDVRPLLEQATIFVSATTRPEPFGLALVDAMAAGLAPIASAHGGPAEIIRHDVTGLLVTPGDTRELADAIADLWTDGQRTRTIGAAAAADVRSRFSIERTADAVETLWREQLAP